MHRRVETKTSPLRETGPPKVKKILDPKLYVGEQVVEELGSPSRRPSPCAVSSTTSATASCMTRRGTRPTSPSRRSSASGRSRGRERLHRRRPDPRRRAPPRPARRPRRRPRPSPALAASTLAMPSASQAGIRVGRSVVASTQACRVQPSAIVAARLARRSTTYSNRNRAPRSSVTRVWMRSSSSNPHGAR